MRHVAWDIGTAALAAACPRILDAPLVLSGYSRLVVDCNRPLEEPRPLHPQRGRRRARQPALSDAEKAARAAAFYWPYQDAVHELVESRMGRDVLPVMISIHSFTPV